MPAQKRALPVTPESNQRVEPVGDDGNGDSRPQSPQRELVEEQKQEERCDERGVGENDSDEEAEESPSSSTADGGADDEYVQIRLMDIRKEVQCPICLGIIRKTRTVMECLHRFCRECIDKSMRLGNKECPACRTHCPSRRSLRDDPKYDALIAALYPDIDKFEEEELAFHEEETNRNKKIQASIAETLKRQTEALGSRRPTSKVTAAVAFMRKSGNFRRGRSRSFARDTGLLCSDDDDDDANGNDGGKDSSSADERCPDVRPKRGRWTVPRTSPALATSSTDGACDENDDLVVRQIRGASPGLMGNREMLVWGKGGVRSQIRHGSASGTNGKNVKGSRISKLVDYLHTLNENESEFDIHLTLVPLDKTSIPGLERPYLCCPPTSSIRHICQFIAHQTSIHAEDIEILVRKPRSVTLTSDNFSPVDDDPLEDELQKLEAQDSLLGLRACFSSTPGNLVLVYRAKNQRIINH